jgi:hypothetical protein
VHGVHGLIVLQYRIQLTRIRDQPAKLIEDVFRLPPADVRETGNDQIAFCPAIETVLMGIPR